MKKYLTISYDPFTDEVAVEANDFMILELFGIIEAAKFMAANNWLVEIQDQEDDLGS